MSWQPFTQADIGLTERETEMLGQHLGTARIQSVLDGVLARIQSAARASGPIDETPGTLPSELRNEATAIVRYLLLLELPMTIGGNDGTAEARRHAYDAAQKVIADLAAGKVPITRPAPPAGGSSNLFAPRWVARPPQFDRYSQKGI